MSYGRLAASLPVTRYAVALAWILASSLDGNVMAYELAAHRWQDRLLLVFAPSAEHPAFRAFEVALSAVEAEVKDRELRVFYLFEHGPGRIDEERLGEGASRELRSRMAPPPDTLAVILIGKDGGVKLRAREPVSLDEIFRLIDSMPMRQDEIRRRQGGLP